MCHSTFRQILLQSLFFSLSTPTQPVEAMFCGSVSFCRLSFYQMSFFPAINRMTPIQKNNLIKPCFWYCKALVICKTLYFKLMVIVLYTSVQCSAPFLRHAVDTSHCTVIITLQIQGLSQLQGSLPLLMARYMLQVIAWLQTQSHLHAETV